MGQSILLSFLHEYTAVNKGQTLKIHHLFAKEQTITETIKEFIQQITEWHIEKKMGVSANRNI